MKSPIFAVVLLTLGLLSLPVLAQQQDLQDVMNAANALSARESELLGKKDAAGIASLFTSDGLLVMLAPQFAFKPGRDAIQKHYQGIIDAGATSITLELKNMELGGNDGVWAAGNYSVTVKDKPIQGNWFRILKRENGNWKIAMEAFLRRCYRCSPIQHRSHHRPPKANRTKTAGSSLEKSTDSLPVSVAHGASFDIESGGRRRSRGTIGTITGEEDEDWQREKPGDPLGCVPGRQPQSLSGDPHRKYQSRLST